ncbi:hypothetical protein [Paenibacillus herberti]|uniref:BclB domain-containing protein n=1 Tax=Paenibacillus herberti TaxID=1619309 RepID=A0A229P537_9BACL|nr:hypothetical protein [Paenibacillus herberti]OXM17210.1 hypothetical protein CGZ75_11555 [Paenibacillus herberti]
MNDSRSAKVELRSFRPHCEDHCKPCPNPPPRNCLIRFTPLQADIFEELLDDLIDSIQFVFTPPSGPLPDVFKELQNLFKSMRLSLRDQADLFAATELPITAYEQSEGWTTALIAATQTALTELYALSLLACVSSSVKDGWVIRIRMAETNLAGIENTVPPVISGTTLVFNGGSNLISLSFNPTTGFATTGVVVGQGFVSQSIPVTTDGSSSTVSIALASGSEGTNYAFSMPQSGTLNAITASFTPIPTMVAGEQIIIQAQLCRALPTTSLYTPFVTIPGAVLLLIPSLSGSVSGITCTGSLNGLNISLNAEDRLVVVFTLIGNVGTTPTFILGTGSASFTVALDSSPASNAPILPFASVSTVDLSFNETGLPISGGAVAFGFSQTESVTLPQSFAVNPLFNQFTATVPGGGKITSVAAYFGVKSGQVIPANSTVNVQALLYRYTNENLTATAFGNVLVRLTALTEGTYTANSPGAHGIVSGLNIEIGEDDHILLVFFALSNTVIANSITGWASGGISVIPNGS